MTSTTESSGIPESEEDFHSPTSQPIDEMHEAAWKRFATFTNSRGSLTCTETNVDRFSDEPDEDDYIRDMILISHVLMFKFT